MFALAAAVIGFSGMFALTSPKRSAAHYFHTASDAAFAAAERYNRVLLLDEIGAKIYEDFAADGTPVYSYGALLEGTKDALTDDQEIVYSTAEADGHSQVVGLWHEHPRSDSVETLAGHDEEIRRTRQAVWTTIGTALYLQYWKSGDVIPETVSDDSPFPALCYACVD